MGSLLIPVSGSNVVSREASCAGWADVRENDKARIQAMERPPRHITLGIRFWVSADIVFGNNPFKETLIRATAVDVKVVQRNNMPLVKRMPARIMAL